MYYCVTWQISYNKEYSSVLVFTFHLRILYLSATEAAGIVLAVVIETYGKNVVGSTILYVKKNKGASQRAWSDSTTVALIGSLQGLIWHTWESVPDICVSFVRTLFIPWLKWYKKIRAISCRKRSVQQPFQAYRWAGTNCYKLLKDPKGLVLVWYNQVVPANTVLFI